MSRLGLRFAVFGFCLLTLATRLLLTFWWQPLTLDLQIAAGFLLYAAGAVVTAAVPLGGYYLMVRKYRPPSTFSSRDGRFVAPSSPVLLGQWSVLVVFIAGGMVSAGSGLRLVALVMAGAALAFAILLPFLPRPSVELSPDGVLIQRFRSRSLIAWALLPPGGPLPPAPKSRTLWLYAAGPVRYVRHDIPLSVDVDRTFLANSIRYYVEHPAARAVIGTEAELTRLLS
ncbi:MAG: hypothetical protein HOU81_19525 [Hamadaea sp.]|uniref:hypothetical protein n=1 Tax=Hamadaea sp. TaxID=2024425 RepID=UPI00180E79FD|nr:hypothetical protein [Hamadaea sp.]NUR73013.1 hypothetical protein [Hamadaea sp.]NUT18042.1 hypothetical protein [Hamadaea sp.]